MQDESYSGKVTVIYDDVYNQMVYFGSAEELCIVDDTGYCSVNITNPETGFSYFFHEDTNKPNIVTTPVVRMETTYNAENDAYVRVNIFNDGSS